MMSVTPSHPTWPGWQQDMATIRRAKALFHTFATAPGAASARAYVAWNDMLPDFAAAEARMEKALWNPARRRAGAA